MDAGKFDGLRYETELPVSYLNLSITILPKINLPSENQNYFYPGFEDQKLLDKGAKWVDDMRKKYRKFKNVNINIFGTSISGQSALIQRYLKPM